MTQNTNTKGDWVDGAVELLREIYEGPATSAGTWITDPGPNSGIFGTLASVSAEQASQKPTCGMNSIAAHTEHLRFSLANANAVACDLEPRRDWDASWFKQQVTEREWSDLQAALRREYEDMLKNLMTAPLPTQETVTGYLSLVGHSAYHLGAIRQLIFRNT